MSASDVSRPAAVPRTRSSLSMYRRSTAKKGSLEDSIRTYKLLEALRSSDTSYLSKFLGSMSDRSSTSSGVSAATASTPAELSNLLHLAVQVASPSTIEFILASGDAHVDVNGVDSDGNTSLHLAAALGREDVVSLLLNRPDINDTITNSAGKQPVELCRYPELAQAMQVSRAQFVEQVASEMKRHFQSGAVEGVERLLLNPRAAALLDINGQDPDTGSTVLHDAVRVKDANMVQFILDHGGDPFRRDRKGKLPGDGTKDETIKKMLKVASKKQSIMTGQSAREAPHMKGYLKKWTNYTGGYKLRWFVLENGILSYYKHQDDAGTACRGSINMRIANLRLDSSEKQRFEIIGKGSVRYHLRANHPVEANRWVWALTQAIQHAKDEVKNQQTTSKQQQLAGDALASTVLDDSLSGRYTIAPSIPGGSTLVSVGNGGSVSGSLLSVGDDDDVDFDDDDDSQEHNAVEPHKDEVGMTSHSLAMEIKVLRDISASIADERSSLASTHPRVEAVLACYDTSLKSLKNLLDELLRQTADRETYFKQRAEQEAELRRVWEENMQKMAEENDVIEEHLHDAVEEKKLARKALREVLSSNHSEPTTPGLQVSGASSPVGEYDRRPSIRAALTTTKLSSVLTEDEDDVFFDAIDNETAMAEARGEPIKLMAYVEEEIEKELFNELQLKKQEEIINDGSFHGYDDPPRTRMNLDEDDRPKISLWGILKSMIGKDMTKMTLPVSFNECTSLLQRVAEDMEYTDLLDQAALKKDSCLRMVYVAAFAASEYSSTINRVAKPFNPLLGETYEYSRPDKGYRFVVEQVSHHPPIGAALAESARWDYWGESAVKSKFNGRSFDINPLGTWFLNIRPVAGGQELYTWKKVTSSVVGIITGSPVVDNYGEMIIRNHTTGDVCKLKYKQRGWLGSSAYEVYGTVVDKAGKPRWSVGGRWNDKIFGRKYQTDVDDSLINLSKESNTAAQLDQTLNVSTSPTLNAPFLVWENHPRPPAPFNLTPFAITLNAIPQNLKPWLPPTDTRLRPDQRAMEDGQYDFAAKEKNRLEEKQRARRRQREVEGSVHQPRWFRKAKHAVTGDEYWQFTGEYWRMRENLGRKRLDGKKRPVWPGVEDIFGA
ncbi:Oxysterol-binding protein-domain-containing protein [Lipomyces kononenkoae]|uniref:Oxysterol-binding protein-domain-containing protein n=1 Tax=Lipomyces kononenkoae TaxID=34357 RepID=A0ACC3T1Q5_LIPKO